MPEPVFPAPFLALLVGLAAELERSALALGEAAQQFERHGLPARAEALRCERDVLVDRANALHLAVARLQP